MLLGLWFTIIWGIKWLNPAYFASFNYETAQHYLELIKLTDGLQLLYGPLTSHTWLRLSSFPYYVFYPLFALLRFHPLSLPLTWLFVSAVTVILNWIVIKKWFSISAAWISSALMMVTANWLYFDEHIGFYNFVIPLMYLFLWSLKTNHRWLPWWWLSIMGCLHASAWMLLPILLWREWRIKRFSWKAGVAVVVPQLPLLLTMMVHKSVTPFYVLAWIPYRMWGFLTGKPLGLNRAVAADTTAVDIVNFFKQSLFPAAWPWWIGIFVIGIMTYGTWKFRKRLYWWWIVLLVGLTTLVVHRNPPLHYFVPIVMVPTVLLSVLISQLPRWGRWLTILFILLINIPVWWTHTRSFVQFPITDYHDIEIVASTVIQDAQGEPFDIRRVGPFDTYPGQAREHYDYMLWYLHHPIQPNASLHYILVDGAATQFDPTNHTLVASVGQIKIYK